MSPAVEHAASGFAPAAKSWAASSRVPFLSVGIMPYLLGAAVASSDGSFTSVPVFWLGLACVVLIMLTTYLNGEYADVVEDQVSADLGRNPFAGGGGPVVEGALSRRAVRTGGYVTAGLAVVIGLVLAVVFKTGALTIPLGVFGLIAGYFYSMPPFRWVERGFGEVLIGICYGWLPVAVGYYLQAGVLPPVLFWVSLPIAFTIFNVIFVNEYPDWEGDTAAGKANLLVRIGRERGVWVYAAAVIAAPIAYVFGIAFGVPGALWPWYAGVVAVSVIPMVMLFAGKWRERRMLVPICALTIVVNLATSAILIASY